LIRIGILGCSEIAFRRFMPALQEVNGVQVVAVAEEYAPTKLENFCKTYSIEGLTSFEQILKREDIDAIYVPQPPALHFKWAMKALEAGKHVLVEKPSTTCFADSEKLVKTAQKNGLALHENYMFKYHSQIGEIKQLIASGEVGEIRLIRANFGFPMRAQNDFRYNKSLGGGALLDAGGYTVKLATELLGPSIKVDSAQLNGKTGYEVDMYGSVSFSNDKGTVCQAGFGMDCQYMCSLEAWCSTGRLFTNRIFTAPVGYKPTVLIEKGSEKRDLVLAEDSSFAHSIEAFKDEIINPGRRAAMYNEILLQAKLVDTIREKGAR
jgi:predicted dehydrogenase